MSSFINGIGLLLVDSNLRLAINGLSMFSSFLISVTDIVQFDIMLVDTMCTKFFSVGSPTLLYVFFANLALYICILVNPIILYSTVVTTLELAVVYVVLETYNNCLFILNLIIPILVWTVKALSFCELYVINISWTNW